MFYHRGSCHDVEALHFKIVALCALFCLSTFGPCTMTGTQNQVGYRNDLGSGSENVLAGDSRTSIAKLSLENVCSRSDAFCFPSTLSGFFSDFLSAKENVSSISGVKAEPEDALTVGSVQNNLNGSSNSCSFQLLSGNVVSCSLELKELAHDEAASCRKSWKTREFNQKNEPLRIKSSPTDDFSSLDVQISRSSLDWGQKYLHSPSLAFLTIENRHNQSVLNVYKPYSTNPQFYPCNHSEIRLGPGEVASICFVFLPKWLGSSSGHLILQTSSGGFLIRAEGLAVESPTQPSVGLNTISLYNPSAKPVHVKEVSAWILFSSQNLSYSSKGVCSVADHEGSSKFSRKEWLAVKVGQVGSPATAMRPHKTWTVGSNRKEPILEFKLPSHSQENAFGFYCVHLLHASSLDTIILEAEFGGQSASDEPKGKNLLSISLKALMPSDINGTTGVSILLNNHSPDLLRVLKISAVGENTVSFQTKYVEGLILFPYTVTQVATVAYTPNPHMNSNCKLLVQTNNSEAPGLEISCSDIASLCSQLLNYENAETKSVNPHLHLPLGIQATEMIKADESVLGNWRSQGTKNGKFVLDEEEVLFPMVHVGSHSSKWIRVVNPSDQPVIMQLLLNSGEIMNKCRESDEVSQPSSAYTLVLNGHTAPLRYGFSIGWNALTEAYVHPHEKAVLGPIIFHPSSRCEWLTSALVRNNLSGVEWLSLRGSGGFVSLALLDGFNPVHTLELGHGFSEPQVKILFAKNTGDLPLEVKRISVSGTKCESDGFEVRSCKGFTLQPGESRKIILSYRTRFCAEMVLRELELAMAGGGILVVPIKASLSKSMLLICKRSLLSTKFKKLFIEILVSGLIISVVCSCMFSFVVRAVKISSGHDEQPSEVCSELETVQAQASCSPENASSLPEKASKPENLTVKTGKEKIRRRKKKRSSSGVLTGQMEATCSPSSNLVTSSTPRRPQELSPQSSTDVVFPDKEDELYKPSTNPPRVRAPGPERKATKPKESSRKYAKLEYSIWGDHLPLTYISQDSLFAISPQEFFKESQLETVSSKQDG